MEILLRLALLLQVLSALAMIGLILVQHGKGADMGAAFGSGASGTLFGASGSANFLSRATAVLAFVFLASTLALAYGGFNVRGQPSGGGASVLDRPAAAAPASAPGSAPALTQPAASQAASAAASGADAIPTDAPVTPPASAPAATPASGAAQIPK
jgi:preprotein translocase subunit SecG